jgi:threonine dehydrogenase-like Zn-dependent dehydrogenase
VRLGEVYPAARVVILGAGPIGLSVLLCAKVSAPCAVYVTDLRDERLAVARRLGADWTGNPHASDVVREIAGYEPWGVDLVFECSGDPTCIAQAMELLTPGGTLVLVGIPVAQEVSFDIHEARTKELVFKNVRRQKGCVMPIIRLIRDRTLDPDAMLTHRFAIQQIQEAFELVANYRDGVVKAVIDISGAE